VSDTGLLLAAAGPPALAAGAAAVRARQRASEQQTFELTFPRDGEVDQAVAAFRTIAGLLPPWWRRALRGTPAVALELHADQRRVTHYLKVRLDHAPYIVAEFAAAIPGIRITRIEKVASPTFRLGRELRLVGSGELRTDATPETTTAVLAAVQPLDTGEVVVVQQAIAPVGFALRAPLEALIERDTATARRSDEPDLSVTVRVAIAAEPKRAGALMARVLGAFHGTRSGDARLGRRLWPSTLVLRSVEQVAPPGSGRMVLAADELAAISTVPIASPTLPGLTLSGSRTLPPVSAIPTEGIVLGDATAANSRRPLAVSAGELRRGLHVCAPTGGGKSTLLLHIARQVMASGHALVVIDSKGDLAAEVADHVPVERAGHAVLFDPNADSALGFNLLGQGVDADLITEALVSGVRSRYGAAGLGPRSEDLLRSSVATLARAGGMTLAEVEPLLTNAAFRRRMTATLDVPVLEGFWAWYESLSEPARAEAVAPLSNKLRTYTLSRRVRTVIGQTGGVDIGKVLEGHGILLVSLASGVVGNDAAGLIGTAMVSRLWNVIQARAGLPPLERKPAVVICDEFQDFTAGPTSFEAAIAQSRGYGVAWVLAHQNLAQLDTRLRQAVLANCRSRVVLQTTASDAAVFAREFAPLLHSSDLQGLGPYEAYAQISTGAAVAPAASLRTRPAPDATGSLVAVRERSRSLGMTSADVDAAIRKRVGGRRDTTPVGGRRRS